ncbi:MAG: TlpA family protein disulfide reductase, partial [Bacteroidetes bacterium]|nr:TlpA family protein disulfide reductase [Bacteroidota bacterium]
MKNIFFLIGLFLISSSSLIAQDNLTFSPEKPQAGEKISITYSSHSKGSESQVEGVVYKMGSQNNELSSLVLTRVGNKYVGSFQTNSEDNFVAIGIKVDGAFDTNDGDGYIVELYKGDSVVPGANLSAAKFYSEDSYLTGLKKDNTEKAIEYYEAAFEMNKDEKAKNIIAFTRLQAKLDITNSDKAFQNNIEWLLKRGLKTELDYYNFRVLYFYANLPEQENFAIEVMKEKFPDGQWVLGDIWKKFRPENSITKKEELLDEYIVRAKKTGVPPNLNGVEEYMTELFLGEVGNTKNYEKLEKSFIKYHASEILKAQILNSIAAKIQEKGENLNQALEFARQSMQIAQKEINNPEDKKPYNLTAKEWLENRKDNYAAYMGTYALIEYKLGNYKAGFPYIKEAALSIAGGKDVKLNNTYILFGKKVLPNKDFQPALASFVVNNAADSNTVMLLKKMYKPTSKKTWDEYYGELQTLAAEQAKKELVKTMVNLNAPDFELFDNRGQKVELSALKNKVVVLDFWATWCGPCKASFPAMQQMVEKYKNDSNVVFLFVDTWERIDDQKEKELVVNKFIKEHKYDFKVLFDHESKIVVSYGISGIPTK